MGLDSVELVMEVEDCFDIRIPDEDAERAVYMRDLHALIVRLLREQVTPPEVCPSMHAFHQTRQAFLEESVYAVPREHIRLEALVESLVVGETRYETWRRIRQRLCLRPPRFSFRRPLAGLSVPSGLSVRDVVEQIVSRSRSAYFRDGVVDEDAVWRSICRVTSEQMGVRESDLHPDIHFIDDLNMG